MSTQATEFAPVSLEPGQQAPPYGAGWLVLFTRLVPGSRFNGGWNADPVVVIDGAPLRIQWGVVALPVSSGAHHIRVVVDMLGGAGPAETMVQIAAGQQTKAYYQAPAYVGQRGNITPARHLSTYEQLLLIMLSFLLLVLGICLVLWLTHAT